MANRFDFVERRDMHFIYGLADGNAREAVRLYAERYPNRVQPNRAQFVNIHRNLGEHGTLGRNPDVTGRPRTRRTVEFEEAVLNRIEENPSTSTRAIAHELDCSNMSVWQVLNDEGMHPFHLQKVQGLSHNDYAPRVETCQWFLQQCQAEPDFASLLMHTDECCFTRDGYFNVHNSHVWSENNPHATHVDSSQHKFSINIWADIIGDHLIGPWGHK
ncbi:hypothetical protein PPYR_02599 [Photinus pyralis]|uniref:DUF4817 domain-containing protein n=1 Tax=Photinus pyralis TaxID=7054 RepID=A0A5N4B7P7_PHOPY|nr:hypothetical protein PPYR_02599 [Photinus pyralis]